VTPLPDAVMLATSGRRVRGALDAALSISDPEVCDPVMVSGAAVTPVGSAVADTDNEPEKPPRRETEIVTAVLPPATTVASP